MSVPAFAQIEKSYRISGKVTDADNNPLIGASIIIIGTLHAVQTGINGNYSLPVVKSGNYQIRFTFIGYKTEVRDLNLTGDITLDITLKPEAIVTDEVIINAIRAGDQTPLAYTNVSGEILKKHNLGQDMPFLLSLTPSFVETSEAGNGIGYTSLRIRGTDASRINVTIDGIPLNDPESQQVFWVDLPDLASSVDNIQVQRGVGTSSNGAGAFGASINIQTRGIENEPFAEINSSAGSFGTFRNNITAGTGLLKERFAFQMRYSDLKSKGYIDRTGSDHTAAFLSSLYRSRKSLIKANLILGKEHTGIGWIGVPKEMLSVNRRYNPAGEYTDENGIKRYYDNESDNYFQNHFQLTYSQKLPGNFSFHSAFHYTKGAGYYEEYREDQNYSEYGLPPVNTGDSTILQTDLIRRKWMSNDFYGLVYSLNYKSNKLEANLGGGMNLYLGDHYGRIIWMRNAGKTEKDYQWYFNDSQKGEVSIYGKINYLLSSRISFFGDLQYRFISYSLSGHDDDLKIIDQVHKYNFINPKAGVFFTISPNHEAFLSFSVANREPTRTDFLEASGDIEATPHPEILMDTELGYKLKMSKYSFDVIFYGMVYKDQLVPTGELNNVGYPIMTNVRNSYRIGSEIIAGLIPADFLRWDLSLTLSTNKIPDFTEYYIDYNTTDWTSEYKSKNLGKVDIAYSPSVIAGSDLGITVFPDFNIHFITKYVGKQYFDNTMNNERMLNPYLVGNLMFDYISPRIKHLRNTEIQLLVNNIFNTRYESNAYGGNWYEDGNEKSWSYYFPQAGFNVLLKLGLKF